MTDPELVARLKEISGTRVYDEPYIGMNDRWVFLDGQFDKARLIEALSDGQSQ